jgi:hypothetical protein
MQLGGKELSLHEVFQRLVEALQVNPGEVAADLPNDIRIRFAKREPICCQFADGRIVVVVRIEQLTNGSRTWRDFLVRAYYRADVSDLDVELIRDGNIELISDQLGFRDRVAVRGIFTKVMAGNHKLQLLQNRLSESEQLKRLVVTQLHIDHGWLGLSLGNEPREVVATESTPIAR